MSDEIGLGSFEDFMKANTDGQLEEQWAEAGKPMPFDEYCVRLWEQMQIAFDEGMVEWAEANRKHLKSKDVVSLERWKKPIG